MSEVRTLTKIASSAKKARKALTNKGLPPFCQVFLARFAEDAKFDIVCNFIFSTWNLKFETSS